MGCIPTTTRFLSAYDPKDIPSIYELLVCQTQAQARKRQGQYLVLPTTTFAQPLVEPGVKLSKLVKEAKELGCETFSGSIDTITIMN